MSGRQEGKRELRKEGRVLSEIFLATYRLYRMSIDGEEVHIKLQANAPFREGEAVEDFSMKGGRTMIYLDNAATSQKKPKEVLEAVLHAMESMGNAGLFYP